jgi:HEAT repeat protein
MILPHYLISALTGLALITWAVGPTSKAMAVTAARSGPPRASADDDPRIDQAIELFKKALAVDRPARREALSGTSRIAGMLLEPVAKDAVGPLLKRLKAARDDETRMAVVLVLHIVGANAKEAIPPVLKFAQDEKAPELLRSLSLGALDVMKLDWTKHLLLLVDAVDAPHREIAMRILEKLGPAAKPALPGLIAKAKKKPYPRLLEVIGEFGPDAKDAVPLFLGVLKETDWENAAAAAHGLGRAGVHTKEVIAALSGALRDEDLGAREEAAEALGRIGPAAKDTLPALVRLLKDDNERVRKAAAMAVRKIQQPEPPGLAHE